MRRLAVAVAAVALLAGACTRSGSSSGPGDRTPDALPSIAVDPCPPPAELLPASARAAGGADRLPDVEFPCLGGGDRVALRRLGGAKPVLLNVWASWCLPCRKEMPALRKVHNDLRDRVLFLGVDMRDDDAPARRTIQDTGVSYPSVVDKDGKLRDALRAIGPPITILVDTSGRVVYRHIGELTEAEIRAALRTHLGVS